MISPAEQKKFHDKNPNNIIHVDYGLDVPGDNKYARAAEIMDRWVSDEVLVQDEKPAIYVTEHEFENHDGERKVRRGFIALLKVEPFSKGGVLPHEKTFKKHKKDRLDLLRETGAQMNPVFTIFPDPQKKAANILFHATQTKPDISFDFVDGAVNRMWRLTDESAVKSLQKVLKKQSVFIADGHHRYETMLNFRRETRKKLGGNLPKDHPSRWGLVYFCAAEDPGLEVTSPHRLVRNVPGYDPKNAIKMLKKYFKIEKTEKNCAVHDFGNESIVHGFALQTGSQYYCMTPKKGILEKAMPDVPEVLRVLHVTICRNLIIRPLIGGDGKILDHVTYIVDPDETARAAESGECQLAIYMPPFVMKQLMDAVETGEVLPHKSTYFYPKLVTGLAIYRYNVK